MMINRKMALRALRRLAAMALLGSAPALAFAQQEAPVPGFGVMVHYLPDKQTVAGAARFDVEALAASLAAMRASYLVLTLGQNNGQFIAPNGALEALCPESARHRPPRDLPLEIGRALERRGIGLVLYLPFRAPQADPYLMACLGDVSEQQPPPARFTAAWSEVIRYWSEHYGPLVRGWWFDGTYNTQDMSPERWNALCAAAKSGGGANRWLAFNPGEGPARFSARAAPCQNLMAGEFMQPPVPASLSAILAERPSNLAFHVLTPLGASWGQTTAPRFSAQQLRAWIADAQARGGLFTLDLPLDDGLRLLPAHVALVRNATTPSRP
jgi:hypothetical protein